MKLKIKRKKGWLLIICSLLAILLSYWLFLSNFEGEPNQTDTPEPIADIMYLVPVDKTKVEYWLQGDEFVGDSGYLSFAINSDWAQINRLALDNQIKAVIIHYAAKEQVNLDELKYLYQERGLFVAGIGIPGDELATMLGDPDAYDPLMKGYNISTYYFAYWSPKKGLNGARGTNLLLNGYQFRLLLGYIGGNFFLAEERRRQTAEPQIRPTLTNEEIEELKELGKKFPNVTPEELDRLYELTWTAEGRGSSPKKEQ